MLASIGLIWLSAADSPVTAILAATVWGTGVCYMWPTMLAAAAERYPRSGAFGMGLIGSAGAAAIKFVLPEMGKIFDEAKAAAEVAGKSADDALQAASSASFQFVAILPAILLVVFGGIWLYDRRKGGFKSESLSTSQPA